MSSSPARLSVLASIALLAFACGGTPPGPAPASEPPAPAPSEPAPAETPEAELKNTLRWTLASEDDNFGFDVYRGTSEEGPFDRITEKPIPGAGDSDEPRKYTFEDTDIEPGQAYWYYVESISLTGQREIFTPIYAAKPKGVPAGGEGEALAPDEAASDGEEGS